MLKPENYQKQITRFLTEYRQKVPTETFFLDEEDKESFLATAFGYFLVHFDFETCAILVGMMKSQLDVDF